ncbi:MAG: hypothetical protein WBD05_01580 [Phycisphaerae bacterium]
MRCAWQVLLLVAAGCIAGCIARHPVSESDLQRWWYLDTVAWNDAEPMTPTLGERTLPASWTLRYQASLLRSTISILRAGDRLKTGAEAIEIGVSPEYAEGTVRIIGRARAAIEDLSAFAEPSGTTDRKNWAAAMARALAAAEHVVRVSTPEERPDGAEGDEETTGLAAGPMLELVLGYLNERADGHLLGEMDAASAARLREVLARAILHLGFDLAGKADPPELPPEIIAAMQKAPQTEALEKTLPETLLTHFQKAPPSDPATRSGARLRAALKWAPKVLEVLEALVRQWDRMESVAFEFRRAGEEPLVAVTLNVAPGREIRLENLFIMQPTIVLRGTTRIVVQAKAPETGEVVVLFEPAADAAGGIGSGSAEVRFEGLGYALVRLLALPLADAALREIRVAKASEEGQKMLGVTLVMEATDQRGDPRRVIAFQDVRRKRITRDPFAVRIQTERLEQVFNYVTPHVRFSYMRTKEPSRP